MQEEYKIVYKSGEGEILEKKSRFIGAIISVKTEDEALAFIESKKKQYWDASHNCYAYIIEEQSEILRISDDGEPGGTAGRPMLDVLRGNHIHNAVLVVTRYFGGTLLGKGGLVRAYTDAAKAAIASAELINRMLGIKLRISSDYTGIGKIQYTLEQNKIKTLNISYTEKVELQIVVEKTFVEKIVAEITEVTNGQAKIEEEGECYFAEQGREVILLGFS